jgi:hypothetical protein
MRRLVCFLVLLVGVSALGWAQSADDVNGATPQATAEIRAQAHKLIASGNPDDVAKGAALLEKATSIEQEQANAEKLAAERAKLRSEMEDTHGGIWKSFVPNLSSLITTMVLAGTLIFQIVKASGDARRADKDSFLEVLKNIQQSEGISPVAALINANKRGDYRADVLALGKTVMMRAKTFEDFRDLYNAVLDPAVPEMEQALEASRALDAIYNPQKAEFRRLWDMQQKGLTLSPEEEAKRQQEPKLLQQEIFLSQRLARLLKERKPGDPAPDLHGIGLSDADLSGCDLHGANISIMGWNRVNLDDCDMSGITVFQYSAYYDTAWWHAAAMSAPLLEYMKTNYPYVPGQGSTSTIALSAHEYEENIARLAAGGGRG